MLQINFISVKQNLKNIRHKISLNIPGISSKLIKLSRFILETQKIIVHNLFSQNLKVHRVPITMTNYFYYFAFF